MESDTTLRSFPQLMEVAHHLACQWCILEEQNIAHGDIAPGNLKVTPEGETYLIDFDNFAFHSPNTPEPVKAGHLAMIAPEIRLQNKPPSIEADRFAYAVLFNMLILRRHPCDGFADDEQEIVAGDWPERRRPTVNYNETPISALGSDLCDLFDRAFMLDPYRRPTADEWRRGLATALQQMVVHDCGNAFVPDQTQTSCPWCQVDITADQARLAGQLSVYLDGRSTPVAVPLPEGQAVMLGRSTLPNCDPTVSREQLQVVRLGKRLHLLHVGRHATTIEVRGQWYRLEDHWVDLRDLPLNLQLADQAIRIEA